MTSFSVFLDFIGCRLNEAELQMWAVAFARCGGRLARRGEPADVIVLNSCTVTAEAARKSRQRIRRLRRDHPSAFLVLTGCYSAIAKADELEPLGADLMVSNLDKETLVEQVLSECIVRMGDGDAKCDVPPFESPYRSRGMQRAFVKIQDGCRYRCAYCIVTIARGAERSRSVEAVLADIRRIEADGLQEIVLAGVQIGGYGSDSGVSLDHLLSQILNKTTIPRIRLSSLEPWNLSDSLLDLLAHPRVLPHLHLPLQSGADTVLKRMTRRGSAMGFRDILNRYFQRVPHGVVTTDIIAGFPGETEAEWQETMTLVEESTLGGVHCFPFSSRAGTVAATLPEQVASEAIHARCAAMTALSVELTRQAAQRFVGEMSAVLWERLQRDPIDHQNHWHGLTPQFMKVSMVQTDTRDLAGVIHPVRLAEFDSNADRFVAVPVR